MTDERLTKMYEEIKDNVYECTLDPKECCMLIQALQEERGRLRFAIRVLEGAERRLSVIQGAEAAEEVSQALETLKGKS